MDPEELARRLLEFRKKQKEGNNWHNVFLVWGSDAFVPLGVSGEELESARKKAQRNRELAGDKYTADLLTILREGGPEAEQIAKLFQLTEEGYKSGITKTEPFTWLYSHVRNSDPTIDYTDPDRYSPKGNTQRPRYGGAILDIVVESLVGKRLGEKINLSERLIDDDPTKKRFTQFFGQSYRRVDDVLREYTKYLRMAEQLGLGDKVTNFRKLLEDFHKTPEQLERERNRSTFRQPPEIQADVTRVQEKEKQQVDPNFLTVLGNYLQSMKGQGLLNYSIYNTGNKR